MHAHTRQRAIFNTIRIVRITMVAIFTSFFHVGVSGVEPYQYYLKIKNQKKSNYINMALVLFTCSMTKEPLPSTGLSSRICLLSKNVFMTIEVCHYNVFTNLYQLRKKINVRHSSHAQTNRRCAHRWLYCQHNMGIGLLFENSPLHTHTHIHICLAVEYSISSPSLNTNTYPWCRLGDRLRNSSDDFPLV